MNFEYEKAIKFSSVATTESLILDDSSSSSSSSESYNENAPGSSMSHPASYSMSELMALKMTIDEEKQELAACSESERLQAVTDLYGTTPCPTELDKIKLLEQELSKIPTERKKAFLQARAASPLLFSCTSHAKLFLRAEDYDPRRAAERMVQYWDKRVLLFGDSALSKEFWKASPFSNSELDYLRHYNHSKAVLADMSMDKEMRHIASDYVMNYEQYKITEMDQMVEALPSHEWTALAQAQRARPELASAPEHKLLFLQSCDFDAWIAARRMVNYWAMALELFGEDEAFFQRVTLARLMEEHSNEINSGFVCLCPGTDASGRVVICIRPAVAVASVAGVCTHEGLMRVVWYIFHAALQLESARVHGIVIVTVAKGQPITLADLSLRKKLVRLIFETIPAHLCFVHMCISASAESWFFYKAIYPIMRRLLGKKMRMRLWLHRGTDDEITSELRGCGLSDNQIPSEVGGSATKDMYRDWLEEQLANGL